MTSSLVGSEMCIRDSKQASNPGKQSSKQSSNQASKQSKQSSKQSSTHTPVSYTHLTLPTICSV
eukprot:5195629-Prorocentrum_lima.AAC.1